MAIRKLRSIFLCLIISMVFLLLMYQMQLVNKLKGISLQDMLSYYMETQVRAPPKPKLILYWSTFFGSLAPFSPKERGLFKALRGDCPVPCKVSTNHSLVNESSAFIVHARDAHMLPPSRAAPWILHTNENPVYTAILSNPQFMSQFKMLVSYRMDSDFPSPFYPMPELTPPIPFTQKDGNIMATFTNCEKVRTEYMKQLMKYVQVDSYGGCERNKNGLIGIYGTAFKQEKMKFQRRYKFSLVFMNQDCDYFVDDRLQHALTSGSIPVYMGTDKVDEFLPGNLNKSIIKVRDFKSPKELADYLKYLSTNETAYNQYLEWKLTGFGDIENTGIGRFWNPKYPITCQICMKLSKGKLPEEGLKPDDCKARRPRDWGI